MSFLTLGAESFREVMKFVNVKFRLWSLVLQFRFQRMNKWAMMFAGHKRFWEANIQDLNAEADKMTRLSFWTIMSLHFIKKELLLFYSVCLARFKCRWIEVLYIATHHFHESWPPVGTIEYKHILIPSCNRSKFWWTHVIRHSHLEALEWLHELFTRLKEIF